MASFTDIIPKFNPYVQQLPVEAMTQVGMAKQQAYEQNVTKIQSQIDAIGGLDVTRPVDRKYLQSKIDQLGSKLATMAAGDFSNFQLVNSVTGMTSQIVKDDVIKTAVNSTAWGRKQREKIEKGKSDGTWSVENEDLYNDQYKKWYNGEAAGESLNAEYFPYRDVYKKLREISKDVGMEESLVQNLFNPDGTVNKVMVETYSKGRDANKIYEAFVNGLDQSDYRQLAITGRYKYKSYDNEQLVEMLKTSNDEYTDVANTRKLDLQQRIRLIDQTLPTTKGEEERKKLEEQRNKILEAITKIDEQVSESNKTFIESKTKLYSGDEEYANNVRARIHMNKFLGTLSKDFADKTSYVKYAENPLWKAIMEEKKFAFDQWQAKAKIAVDWAKVAVDQERNRIEREKEENRKKEKEAELNAYSTAGMMGGGEKATYDGILSSFEKFTSDRDQQFFELAKSCFDGDVEALNKYVAAAQGVKVKDPKTGVLRNTTREEVLERLGAQEYARVASLINNKQVTGPSKGQPYGDNPTAGLNPQLLERVYKLSELNTLVSGMKATMESIDKNLDAELTFAEKYAKDNPNLYADERVPGVGSRVVELFGGTPGAAALAFDFISQKAFNLDARSSQAKAHDEAYVSYREKLRAKYEETFSGFYPQNLGFVMNEKNKNIVVAKMNSSLLNNPAYTQKVREALFKNDAQLVLSATPNPLGLGETTYSAIVTGADGKQYDPIMLTAKQYEEIANRKAPAPDMASVLTRARVEVSPDNSTNLQGLGNWQTALVQGGSFTNIKSYNIGGMDLSQSTTDPNTFYPVLYIAPPGSSDYKQYPIQRAGTLSEGMALPYLITDSDLKAKGITF